jgi:hypothetical protein
MGWAQEENTLYQLELEEARDLLTKLSEVHSQTSLLGLNKTRDLLTTMRLLTLERTEMQSITKLWLALNQLSNDLWLLLIIWYDFY